MTLYRAGGDSPIVRSLIRAAERGVQVAVLVELKARFDEQTNIAWAKQLGARRRPRRVRAGRSEDARQVRAGGARGARRASAATSTSAPATTTRRRPGSTRTSALLSCDPALGADLIQLFNHITGYSREPRYRKLLVAPRWLRPMLADLIANEQRYGRAGRIIMKMNSLADPPMVDALYEASQAGVGIDLVVRGICMPAAGRARAVRDDPGARRSSGATSSTAGSSSSPTAPGPGDRRTTSARPT